jgi:hypothetical protein
VCAVVMGGVGGGGWGGGGGCRLSPSSRRDRLEAALEGRAVRARRLSSVDPAHLQTLMAGGCRWASARLRGLRAVHPLLPARDECVCVRVCACVCVSLAHHRTTVGRSAVTLAAPDSLRGGACVHPPPPHACPLLPTAGPAEGQ